MTRHMSVYVLAAMIVAMLLAACGQREQAGQGPATSSTTPSTSVPSSSTLRSATPSPEPNEPTRSVLGDGRYPAYLTAIDTHARTLTFDVIQYLTGEEARAAYHRDHPEISEGPPNGYYIVNQNPRLRTLPVRDNAPILVLWLGAGLGSEMITIDQLPGYFAKDPVADKYLWYDPFWLTVRGGRIDALAEQYIP